MNGIESIAAERQRQIDDEGWTPEHDDRYRNSQLRAAAYCYIRFGDRPGWHMETPPIEWPWHRRWWKPRGSREDLIRAGALIAAEIDRLDRVEANKESAS